MNGDMMTFRPLFWPTFFTIPAIILLISLGSWQLSRLAEKTELIAQFEQRSNAAAIGIHQVTEPVEEFEFQRIGVKGTYLHQSEIYLTGRTYEGNAGFHVVTPFLTSDGVILINRGWVSEAYREPSTRAFSLTEGIIFVEGILRLPGRKGYFVPENEPEAGFWFTLKLTEIAQFLKQEDTIKNYYIDDIRTGEIITLPIAAEVNIDVPNSHFNYALTWFGLALALIGVYLAFHHQNGRLQFSSKSTSD